MEEHPAEEFLRVAHHSRGHLPQIKVLVDFNVLLLILFPVAFLDGHERAVIRQAARLHHFDRFIDAVDHVHVDGGAPFLLAAEPRLILESDDPGRPKQPVRLLQEPESKPTEIESLTTSTSTQLGKPAWQYF